MTRFFAAVFLLTFALQAGCGDDDVADDDDDVVGDDDDDSSDAGGDASTSGTIGPEGGTVMGALASVIIPPGALEEETEIGVDMIFAPPVPLPSNVQAASATYAFTPHGTTFEEPVTLRLPFTGEGTEVMRLDDEDDSTWEMVDSEIDGQVAEVTTSGFSYYNVVRFGSAPGGDPSDVTYTWTIDGAPPDAINCEGKEILAVLWRAPLQMPYYEASPYCMAGTHTFMNAPPGEYYFDLGFMAPNRLFLDRFNDNRDLDGTNMTIAVDFMPP